MKTNPTQHVASEDRRRFLRHAVTGAGVATAAAALPQATLASPEVEPPPAKDGYRLSKHILDYYKTAAG